MSPEDAQQILNPEEEEVVEAKIKKKKKGKKKHPKEPRKPRRKKNKLGYPDYNKLDTQLFPNKKPPYVEK